VHYVVKVVHGKTAVVAGFASDAAKSIIAFTPGFVSSFSGKETR
jgi:hypothetical protein